MAYVNYDYYVKEFNNGRTPVISESDFKYYEARARRAIQMYTLKKSDSYSEGDEVKDCTCALAEKYYLIDKDESSKITSEKVGEYSVTYKQKTMEEVKEEVQKILKEYLAMTGLLYRGQ